MHECASVFFLYGMATVSKATLAKFTHEADPVLLSQFERQYDELVDKGINLLGGDEPKIIWL
ncbi:hypothetical protein AGMMS50276_05370 [Synergistales bacterium]|nr:hypothetical protein AGMMS50276_05370 [Synergistales bacterium]